MESPAFQAYARAFCKLYCCVNKVDCLLYQEMKDDLDHYTNTYQIFTKAPDKLEEVLAQPQLINWDQVFQIQGN